MMFAGLLEIHWAGSQVGIAAVATRARSANRRGEQHYLSASFDTVRAVACVSRAAGPGHKRSRKCRRAFSKGGARHARLPCRRLARQWNIFLSSRIFSTPTKEPPDASWQALDR
jgi:hypothetical protein